MKSFICTIVFLSMIGLLFCNTLNVGQNQTYSSIYIALEAADPGDLILVHPGTYVENIEINIDDLTIESLNNNPDETIIDGNGIESVICINGAENILIRGFTIQNGTGSTIAGDRGYWGGGVLAENSDNLQLDLCIIKNNEAEIGGGVAVRNGSAEITKCNIQLNDADYGAGINIINTISDRQEDLIISNSKITNNTALFSGGGLRGAFTGAYISADISSTLIALNSAGNSGAGLQWSGNQSTSTTPPFYLSNVTIADNTSPVCGGFYVNHNTVYDTNVFIVNCIIWGNSGIQIPTSSLTTINYSDVQGGYTGNGNINSNPQFELGSNGNYDLKWNSIDMSPCIDSGDPTLFDLDGTRSDMGCYPFTGERYINDSWCLYSYNAGDRNRSNIKWQGLPALDTYTTNGTVVENVFAEIMGEGIGATTTLDTCSWKELETNNDYVIFENVNGWNNSNETLSRIQGYKFVVIPNLTQSVVLDIYGEQVADNTIIPLKKYIPGTTTTMENWICYHLDRTQEWDDALGSSIDNIYSVKTQYWTMHRAYKKPGAPWCLPIYSDMTLSRGDMVIIECFSDEDFVWSNQGFVSSPNVPAKSTAFTYEEELDYLPVNIEFDEANTPLEVAVLADGVCQGAAVVEDGSAQVCAYITDNAGENMELEFYFGERSAVEAVKSFKVFNAEANCFVSKTITIDPNEDYYQISLREDQEVVETLPTALSINNYPNPFNPTTIVSFNLPAETMVELEVYNVRGQLVKSLLNEVTPAGLHSVEWNGIDNSGQKVSSGIYFSRLKTKHEVLNKKMILLK